MRELFKTIDIYIYLGVELFAIPGIPDRHPVRNSQFMTAIRDDVSFKKRV